MNNIKYKNIFLKITLKIFFIILHFIHYNVIYTNKTNYCFNYLNKIIFILNILKDLKHSSDSVF